MSVCGRTPAATTSRSASSRRPSASPTPSTWSAAEHLGGEDVEVHGDAERLDAALEDRAGLGVELHVHQVGHRVHELDLQPVALQRAGRLEAEQPAAHDDGPPCTRPTASSIARVSSMVRNP